MRDELKHLAIAAIELNKQPDSRQIGTMLYYHLLAVEVILDFAAKPKPDKLIKELEKKLKLHFKELSTPKVFKRSSPKKNTQNLKI